jgi:hypothetical protein
MKKTALLGFLCFHYWHFITAQSLLHTIESVDCQYFTTDALYNIYVVTNDNELLRYDTLGNITARFSDKKAGHLKSVLVENPFQIVLYYDDYQQITLLDKQLTIASKHALYDMGIQQVSAITVSDRSEIWLYDAADAQLKKWQISAAQNTTQNQYLRLPAPPTSMCVQDNILYLKTHQGLKTYDIFGQFIADWAVSWKGSFQIFDNHLYFMENNELVKYNATIRFKKTLPLPQAAQGAQAFRIQKNKLFVLNKDVIQIYGY